MRFSRLGATDLEVSQVGFGLWTVAAGRRGNITEAAGVDLLRKAYDLEINLFDTADTYGDGYGEEILAKALGRKRHQIVIGTKFGYDLYADVPTEPGEERSQNFSPEFVRYACERSLRRLKTDYIDLYQLHHPRIDAIESDGVFETLAELVTEGKIRYYGVALGPDVGWSEEGEASMTERKVAALQTIYSIIEQEPADRLFPIAEEEGTGLLIREPHASGILDGTYAGGAARETDDAVSSRRQERLERGPEKAARLDFLTDGMSSTIGQIAIRFALTPPRVAAVLPSITNRPQLEEFAAAPDTEEIPRELQDRIAELYEESFYLEPTA